MESTKQPHKKSILPWIVASIAIVITVGLAVAWCFSSQNSKVSTVTPVAKTGPCKDGTDNALPAGFSWYESSDLGFKFAYPSSWGDVTVATTPTGGVSGHYIQGSFTKNTDVAFGGNATDYVVNPRDGMPTDNPGYLQAGAKFYTVQIWKLHNPTSGTDESKTLLFPIDQATTLKDACNTKAALTQYPMDEFFGYAYDVARFTLRPTNVYYGVNVVAKNPTAATRSDFDKLIGSFQLLP